MTERYTLNKSLYVRASMFTTDELRRQKRLGLSALNEEVLDGLVEQRSEFERQQQNGIRSLVVTLFFGFVAWNGGDIKIPGTGISVGEVPAFLELSLVASAFSVLMITYTFLSIQMYNAVISSVAEFVLAKNELDPDLFAAAKAPTWLFIKYSQKAPVNGRLPGYRISKWGDRFYRLLIGSTILLLLGLWLFSIACIVFIAHTGLADTFFGWSVYILSISMIFVSFLFMAANSLEFEHEMDFEILESASNETDDIKDQ